MSVNVPVALIATISNAFNPLLKVLCNFPSWYLFAIELEFPWNFRYCILPDLYSRPGEYYSTKRTRCATSLDMNRIFTFPNVFSIKLFAY